jgi:hypothetical protein
MLNLNVTTNSRVQRYLSVGNLPLGTYTVTSTWQNIVTGNPAITSVIASAVDATPTIVVTSLVAPITVMLSAPAVTSATFSPGSYIADLKFVDVHNADNVYYSPQYKITVTASIS